MTKEEITNEKYEHIHSGMVIRKIVRIKKNGKETFPVFEIVKTGSKNECWVNELPIGHRFGCTHILESELQKKKSWKRIQHVAN